MSEVKDIRHWWIQKPIAHNCPVNMRAAVFEEFEPTIREKNCEWIKVFSADDLHKKLGMGLSRYSHIMQVNGDLQSQLEACKKERDEANIKLEQCRRERDHIGARHNEWMQGYIKLSDEKIEFEQKLTEAVKALEKARDYLDNDIATLECESRVRTMYEATWEDGMALRDVLYILVEKLKS